MNLELETTDWNTARAELMAIRERVFVEEQGVPIELEQDRFDANALHLLARVDRAPVGTARLLEDGHIGRIAVLFDWRRQGIGGRMLDRLIELAAERGRHRPFLHAQCAAIPFYERFGFRAEGPVFLDAGIEHRLMRFSAATGSD